jgi:hypothetical protein
MGGGKGKAMLAIVQGILDVAGVVASAIAAWLWYRAGAMTARRVDAEEVFDYHD